jgi:flagellar motor switch protein FliM
VYSLRRPVAIAPDEESSARCRLSRIATALEAALRSALESPISIQITGFQQEQAHAAIDTLPAPGWILAFPCEDGGFAVAVDPACALSLVELALGGAGNSPAKGREPTPLESRVMQKLCSALAEPLGRSLALTVTSASFRTGSLPDAIATAGRTVCVGVLGIDLAGHERSGLLLATPNLLRIEPEADVHEPLAVGPLAPRIDLVRVGVRPVLQAGRVTLSDIIHLEPGAVLRLDAPADAPIELRVAGRSCLRGTISREGSTAVFRVSWRRRGHAEPPPAKEKKG